MVDFLCYGFLIVFPSLTPQLIAVGVLLLYHVTSPFYISDEYPINDVWCLSGNCYPVIKVVIGTCQFWYPIGQLCQFDLLYLGMKYSLKGSGSAPWECFPAHCLLRCWFHTLVPPSFSIIYAGQFRNGHWSICPFFGCWSNLTLPLKS